MIETKYSKILVGVDGSRESMNAATHALGLARKDNAEVICLTALQLLSFYGWSTIENAYVLSCYSCKIINLLTTQGIEEYALLEHPPNWFNHNSQWLLK
jgi:hypothetical protein